MLTPLAGDCIVGIRLMNRFGTFRFLDKFLIVRASFKSSLLSSVCFCEAKIMLMFSGREGITSLGR